jgi:ACS family D-galactonate transporter-like MFS transporter
MAFIKVGFLGFLPFLAAFVGVLLSGFLSDFLVRLGFSPGIARKTPDSPLSLGYSCRLLPRGVAGVINFVGNLSSIFAPLIIGFLVKGGNFAPVLVLIGELSLVGAF